MSETKLCGQQWLWRDDQFHRCELATPHPGRRCWCPCGDRGPLEEPQQRARGGRIVHPQPYLVGQVSQPHTEIRGEAGPELVNLESRGTPIATPTPHQHTGPGPFHPECPRCQGIPAE